MRISRVCPRWAMRQLVTWVLAGLALVGPALAQNPAPVPTTSTPDVLVLLSTGYGQSGIDNYVKGLYGVLREQGVSYTRIHIEYLDLVKNPEPAYRQSLGQLLAQKYPASRVGVIVTMQPAALDFLLKEGAGMSPAAAVMVAQAKVPAGADKSHREFFRQTPTLDFAGTLQRALDLFPKTRHVVLLAGNSEVEQERVQDARRQFAQWQGQLDFEYLDGKSFADIERQLANAPDHTVIIAPGINRDGTGQVFVPVDTIVRIARTANAPVFPVYSVSIGQGAIGGMVSILEDEGKSMALSVLELLRRTPGDLRPFTVRTAKPVALFDWQQIERWGGDWTKLPADTVYLNRPPSFWGQYKGYVVGGAVAILLLSALVIALAMQNRRRLLVEKSLRASQGQYRLLADNMSDVLWTFNLDNKTWEYVSPSIQRLLGYSVEEFTALSLRELLAADTYEDVTGQMALRVAECLKSPDRRHSYTDKSELLGRDGSAVWVESVTHYIRDEQGHLTLLGMTRDINQRMADEKKIKQLAFFDALTQLPNRKLLMDRMHQALVSSSRSRHTGALLFIDLDHFKNLNDTLGHDVGDLLLQKVAQRLAACVRAGDTVARLGGDEFVILLEELDESSEKAATEARSTGEKILAAFSHDFQLDQIAYRITASIGIALFKGDAEAVDELLKRADLAMYQAKSAGRDALRFFDPQMQALVTARAGLEADLRKALLAGQFLLHYQPQVHADGRVIGAEALVRWQHPERGLVSPAEFIPLAEETGLILGLGQWVMETACKQLLAWEKDAAAAHLSLAINVSSRQFRHVDFVPQVLAVLQRTGANPRRLKLELTESLLLDDVEDTISKMELLKMQGVSFSLDDFGTGYSSLAYLKRLPLDQLKIDQSFVRDVLTDSNDAAIARTVVALAQSLGLSVIAEGVETQGQRDFLDRHGCQFYQGYLFSRPLPVDAFNQFLKNGS
jgi:diguanylate cyclase (GGDEF)-like protein/PAS domain S-box-containing protein